MAETSEETHPAHLSPSELGTKEYWETFYTRTLTHISTKHNPPTISDPRPDKNSAEAPNPAPENSDHNSDDADDDDYNGDSDPGTSWFSEHNAPQKVLDFLTNEFFPLAPCNTLPSSSTPGSSSRQRRKIKKLSAEEKSSQPRILDLGTGNGSMLALLRKRGGFRGDLVGVDYSERSVELARELQRVRGHEAYLSGSDSDSDSNFDADDKAGGEDEAEAEDEWDDIRFEEWDILNHSKDKKLDWFPDDKGGFDIVLDKGTFDAVSLMVEKGECERYPAIVGGLVRKGGFLVVTSCNWTEEELVRWFTSSTIRSGNEEAGKLVVWGKVEYPRFRFGGKEGQGVCTVCFQRVDN